jgi:hypothetical protein
MAVAKRRARNLSSNAYTARAAVSKGEALRFEGNAGDLPRAMVVTETGRFPKGTSR